MRKDLIQKLVLVLRKMRDRIMEEEEIAAIDAEAQYQAELEGEYYAWEADQEAMDQDIYYDEPLGW